MKVSERLYRWLLRFYPREFRDEYGHEMSLVFRDRATRGSVILWLQVIGDLLFHAPQEHWSTTKQDLRFAFRQIRRSPGFSGVVIVTLALGIGGTTAVFSVLQAVLLAPLPYEEPGQLVRFYQQEPEKPATRHYLTGRALQIASRRSGARSKASRRSTTTAKPGRISSEMGAPSECVGCGFRAITFKLCDRPCCAARLRTPRRARNAPRLRGWSSAARC